MSQARSAEQDTPAGVGTLGRVGPERDAGARASPASPAIHVIGLTKRYGDIVAVNGLDMTVRRGEVFGFLGPNGAGKTTVVKMLLGLARPSAGEGLVLGAPLGDRETRRQVGYLPELFRFQALLSAREVLRLHCRLLEIPKRAWAERAEQVLETVGLADRAGGRVGTFSKGMQQRLGLAVALLGEPELIVLDEPTSALDPVGRHDVREIVRGLRGKGATVFLNTHLLEEAEQICDRVAVIDRGTALATGSLRELLGRQSRVRVKVTGLADGWRSALGRHGSLRREGEWLEVEGIEPDEVADLVAQLVSLGGRIEAVVPEHQTLEARFLELLGS